MKIGTNAQNYAAATFSFGDNNQKNPKTFVRSLNSQRVIQELPSSQIHFYIDEEGIKPRIFNFSGSFFGADREIALRNLQEVMMSTGIKRFWLNSDYFYIGTGTFLKNSMVSKQTHFINYNGEFALISPFKYGATMQTDTFTSTSDGSWVNNTSGMTNTGNAPAHIHQITVTNVSDGNIKEVRIADAANGGGNIVTWKGTLSVTKSLIIYLVYATSGAPGVIEKVYALNNGSHDGSVRYHVSNNNDFIRIEADTTNQDFSAYVDFESGVGSGASIKLDWYNSYFD